VQVDWPEKFLAIATRRFRFISGADAASLKRYHGLSVKL